MLKEMSIYHRNKKQNYICNNTKMLTKSKFIDIFEPECENR